MVYSATVTSTVNGRNETKKTYIGLTEPPFKRRFTVHKHTFNERNTPNDTSLSKYIWNLKDTGATWEIKWEILRRAGGYNKSTEKMRDMPNGKTVNLLIQTKGVFNGQVRMNNKML